MDVKRAADLYAQGWTLRQIGAELGVTVSTVNDHPRRAGVTMRRGAPRHPASTQQILELLDQGWTWPEIAQQVEMTVSGAWSRHRRAQPSKPPRLGRSQQVLAGGLDKTFRLASERPSLIISAELPPALSSPLPDEQPTVSPPRVVPACCTYRAQMPMQATAPI